MRMEVLTYLKVVTKKWCNFVAALDPAIITLRPSLDTLLIINYLTLTYILLIIQTNFNPCVISPFHLFDVQQKFIF